jgi:hypothetical protein
VEDGIPAVFSPPPHEYCLVPATEWPQRYTRLLEATTRREPGAPGTSEEVARRWVGGGGFRVDRTDSKPVPPALTVREPWQGGTVRFDSRFDVDDVLERARLWLTRKGSPFGDFLDQRLRGYLSPVQNGRPVADLQQRINRFKDGLQDTLQSATPLVYIDSAVFGRVHPRSGWRSREMTTLVAEDLPLPPGSEARQAAEDVLRATVPPHRPVEEFFSDGTVDVEGVLYVSRLAGAVHPATVTSLTAPIAQRWAAARSAGAIGGFWQNRRARPLAEFCPVSPAVLDQMIRGWFTGRLLGIIPDPTAQQGFQIGYERYGEIKRARFPWPLLRGGPELIDRSLRREWLPGLLETLVISFVLVAAETDSVDAYDELWKLGGSSALRGWIVEGKSVAALTTPQVNGSTAQERKDHVLDALVQMREPYHHELTSTAVVDDPAQFFRIPYGFELYPRLLSALDSLEAGISAVSTGGEEFG